MYVCVCMCMCECVCVHYVCIMCAIEVNGCVGAI